MESITKSVNVCFGDFTLKTVKAYKVGNSDNLSIDNSIYNFPDSDLLYLEDINGYHYKRYFCDLPGKTYFYFAKI